MASFAADHGLNRTLALGIAGAPPGLTLDCRHAAANYGLLCMAQGSGSILGGPAASPLHDRPGSWTIVFEAATAAGLPSALLAVAVLKPMRNTCLGAG